MAPHLHSSSTTPAKSAHYTQSLSNALSSGSWGDKQLVKAPNGTGLDWAEGVRKWGKHTGGDTQYLHLLRNVSLAYLSSHPPSAGSSSVPPRRPLPSSNPHAATDTSHETHSRNPEADTAPPSSASDNSRETARTTTTTDRSFVSVPAEGSDGTERTSGSSYVHVGGSGTAGLVGGEVEGGSSGLAPPIMGITGYPLMDTSGAEDGRLDGPGVQHSTTTMMQGEVRGDQESASTVMPREVEESDVPVSETAPGPPVMQARDSEMRSDREQHKGLDRMTTSAPLTSSVTTGHTPDFLSPAYLDGDESESEILALDRGRMGAMSASRNNSGGDLRGDLSKVQQGSRGSNGGVLSRAYALLLAYYHFALNDPVAAVSTYEAVDWSAGMDTTGQETGLSLTCQRVDWVRGMVVFGMSLEAMGRENEALDRYLQAIRVFADTPGITLPLTDTFLVTPPVTTQGLTGAKVLPTPARPVSTRATPTFSSHREAHRWVSTALTRATIISARTKDLNRTTRLARTYHVISKMWPTTFRSSQQAFMLSLYLRVLHAGHIGSGANSSAEVDWLVCEIPNSINSNVRGTKSQLWSREWIQAVKEGKRLLSETTTFPRAGQTNWKVQRFVEDAMDVWQRSGCGVSDAKEVVKIVWWSVEMTFHSQAILRHLMRLLLATGQHDDAKRVFELYVKLVLKARQTSQPEVSLELRQSSKDEHSTTRPAVQETDDAEFTGETEGQEDMDSDEDFLEGLLLGARILTQDIGDPIEAWRYISLASDVLTIASPRVTKTYEARVEESKGIIRMAMAIEDAEPSTRPTYQSEGISHLVAATELASGDARIWYHLAYARTEARDVSGALDAVRQALELEPTNAEAWHLLALLLSATKDWAGALRAVQAGIELWETVEQELKQSLDVNDGTFDAVPVGVERHDYAIQDSAVDGNLETSPTTAVILDQTVLPISKRSHKSLYPKPSVTSRLGHVIQLRMTQAVITEKLYGPDDAMIKQQENFAYFSGRSGFSRPGGHASPGLVDDRSVRDLGESFFNVKETTPAGVPYMGETQIISPQRQPQGEPVLSRSSTTHAGYDVASPPQSENEAETRSLSGKKHRFLSRHLHVPGSKRNDQRSSVGAMRTPTEAGHVENRPRAVSNGASIRSRGTTAAHSHYHGARPPPPPAPPINLPSAPPSGRNAAETRLLANLWLQSAGTFRRSGKLEQALGAIQEAEVMDPSNAEVWVQLGSHHAMLGDNETALKATGKALVLSAEYAPAVIRMSELYLDRHQPDLAHGLLNPFTQGRGWDVAEAWYLLARVCQAQGGRAERARECLLLALQLEKARLCRPLDRAVNRWV